MSYSSPLTFEKGEIALGLTVVKRGELFDEAIYRMLELVKDKSMVELLGKR